MEEKKLRSGIFRKKIIERVSSPEKLNDYYDRLPLTEIALTLGMSYGAAKLRHQKALALLRREMAEY